MALYFRFILTHFEKKVMKNLMLIANMKRKNVCSEAVFEIYALEHRHIKETPTLRRAGACSAD